MYRVAHAPKEHKACRVTQRLKESQRRLKVGRSNRDRISTWLSSSAWSLRSRERAATMPCSEMRWQPRTCGHRRRELHRKHARDRAGRTVEECRTWCLCENTFGSRVWTALKRPKRSLSADELGPAWACVYARERTRVLACAYVRVAACMMRARTRVADERWANEWSTQAPRHAEPHLQPTQLCARAGEREEGGITRARAAERERL
eukprot:1268400-Pleurochrysis_carterae.AAC.3